MGQLSIPGPWPKHSEELEYIMVLSMCHSSHICHNGDHRSPFPRVTFFLWAATLLWTLRWPEHAQMVWPKIFPTVNFRLAQTFVFVHLVVVVAEKTFGPEPANGLFGDAPRAPKHATLVEHAHHVPARLLVHDNIIATLHPVQQNFMRPGL